MANPVAFGMTVYGFGFWVEPWAQEFGASRGEIMIGITAMNAVSAVISPFLGHALDRYSIRTLTIIGSLLLALGMYLTSIASSIWFILVLYMLVFSIVVVLVGPLSASTLMAKWFDKNRGLAIGIASVGTSIGGLLLPILIGYSLVAYGWRDTHAYLAIMAIVLIIPPVWWVIRNTPEEKGLTPEEPAKLPEGVAPVSTTSWTTREVLRDRTFLVLALSMGLLMMAFMALVPNLIPYALDSGIDVARASVMMSVLAAGGIVGKLVMGFATDRIQIRVLVWITNILLLSPMLILMGAPGYGGLLAVAGLIGLSSGGFTPLIGATIASRFGPAAFGRIMGLMNPFTLGLGLFGPPVTGFIFDETQSYDLALQIFSVMMVISAIAAFFLITTPKPETADE